MKKIDIVVPCYNESENIRPLYQAIKDVFSKDLPDYDFNLLLVNDGSKDSSLSVLQQLAKEDERVKYLSFSRNFGHQLAVKAGLDHAFAPAVISMDADLQHPPTLIPTLVHKWEEGAQVVATLRTYPAEISKKKRKSSQQFYKLLNLLSDIEIKEASKTDSVEVFEKLCRYADEQISKAILGQTLTSDSGGGSYAQSKTHNEVRKDILVADCKALSATLRRDLIEPLVRFNFGSEANIPYLKFDMEDSEDLKALSEVLNTLVNDLGLKVPEEYVYKKFSIPQPNEGETILEGRKNEVSAIEMKTLKNDKKDVHSVYQEKIDRIADETIKTSGEIFQEIFTPVLSACNEASTLEDLKDKLQDESFVTELMGKMENPEMEDLLQRSMFLADLCGRMIEHE